MLWRPRLAVALCALAAFGASLGGSFHFDDYALLSDPAITSPNGWLDVWRPLQTRPLTYLTFWANHRLGGSNPQGYHAVNLLLHAAAALLLFEALARVVPRTAAVTAAAIFAVHPIQTEAVAYVFARASLLAAVLCLASFLSWLRGRHWTAAAWFAAALLAKEECAAYPLFLFLLYLSISKNAAELRPIAAMLGLSLVFGARVLYALAHTPGAQAGGAAGISPAGYFAAQGPVIWRYFRLLLIPWGFTVDPDIRPPEPWLAAVAWLCLLAVAVLAGRRFTRARAGFWILAGLVLLAPSSSIFPAQDLAADRRVYLPMLAWSAAFGLLAQRWKPAVAAVAVVLLAALAVMRTQVWMTEQSLWSDAVRRAPAKVRPRIQLARASQPAEALALLSEAKRLAPDNSAVASELGRVYLASQRPADALSEFGRALALDPTSAGAVNNRGAALFALGQLEAARRDFESALRMDPTLAGARDNLRRLPPR